MNEQIKDHEISAMREGVEYRLPIVVRNFKMMVRPLSIDETVQVAADVTEEMNKMPEKGRNRLTEETLLAKFTIEKASTSSPETNDPKITAAVLGNMTPDELHAIFKQYVWVCDRVNPVLESMSPEKLQEIVDLLKKNSLQVTELSTWDMAQLVLFFIAKDE